MDITLDRRHNDCTLRLGILFDMKQRRDVFDCKINRRRTRNELWQEILLLVKQLANLVDCRNQILINDCLRIFARLYFQLYILLAAAFVALYNNVIATASFFGHTCHILGSRLFGLG